MKKVYEGIDVLKYPWEQVAQAFWQRYPNSWSTHVLKEDTVFRKVVGNCLHSKRFLVKTNQPPKWAKRITSAQHVHLIEESIVDPEKKEICTYTRNISLRKVMVFVEKVTFRPSSENGQWTVVERDGWNHLRIYGLDFLAKNFIKERFKKNVQEASKGSLQVLNRLFPIRAPANLVQSLQMTIQERRQRLKDVASKTAKRAEELSQAKARPIFKPRPHGRALPGGHESFACQQSNLAGKPSKFPRPQVI